MALDFPNNPNLNDIHNENGIRFQWDGGAWIRIVSAGNQGFQGVQGAPGGGPGGVGVGTTTVSTNSLVVSGVSTFNNGITTFTSGGIHVTGVVTATTFNGALKGLPQNTQTSAYALVAGDVGKNVAITTGGVTLNTGVFDVGDTVSIYNDSEFTQMINVGVGVSMRRVSIGDTGNRGLNQYGLATIMCIRNNEYVITGAGLT